MTIRPTTFPSYLNHFVHPGVYSPITSTVGMYGLKPEYDEAYTRMLTEAGYNDAMESMPSDEIRRTAALLMQKHLMTSIDRPLVEGSVELHDREYHEKMLATASPYLSQDLTTFTPAQLLQMFQGMQVQGQGDPSTHAYRSDNIVVAQRGVITTQLGADDFMPAFLEQHAPEELPIYHAIQSTTKRYCQSQPAAVEFDFCELYEVAGFTDQQKAFLDKYFHRCPPAATVPDAMKSFARELLARLKSGEDPITTAVFAHTQIIRIHPFGDSNGRLARAIMNLILAHAGLPPIAFAFDREYCGAIEETTPQNPAFEKLIRRKIKENTGKDPATIEAELTAIAEASKNARAIQAIWEKIPIARRKELVADLFRIERFLPSSSSTKPTKR